MNSKAFRWEQRESNPRPSACKADALNQLSYAPVSFLFADNCVRLRIFSRSLPQGNSLLQSLSSLFSTKINFNFLATYLVLEQNKRRNIPKNFSLAVRTGLEPATPGVTGRYSNQLNYRTNVQTFEPMEGIEPTTPRLQITCSGQLSYIGNVVSFLKGDAKI